MVSTVDFMLYVFTATGEVQFRLCFALQERGRWKTRCIALAFLLAGILVFRLCTDAEKIISGMFRAEKVKKEMFSML